MHDGSTGSQGGNATTLIGVRLSPQDMGRKGKQTTGAKYSDRLCFQVVAVLMKHDNEPMSVREIIQGLIDTKLKNVPTSNQLANTISKSGYFVKMGERYQPYWSSGANGKIQTWAYDPEKCRERGWTLEPRQNRPLNDPWTPESTNRYGMNGALMKQRISPKE